MEDFLKIVQRGIAECKIESNEKIGLAVSGGADSVSLLASFCKIFDTKNLFVLTIDHNIRENGDSKRDADFVEKLCKDFCVSFTRIEFEKGLVKKIEKERKEGTEEAARFLRYKAFEDFAQHNDIKTLCTAHNKNDFVETLLMRFLQGSGENRGILARRGIFCRPLLFAERTQIEDFLKSQNLSFRTDKTNFDTTFFRNRIRQKLIPFLNENFAGFQNALIFGAEKSNWDCEYLSKSAENIFQKIQKINENSAKIDRKEFDSQEKAIKLRLLHELLKKAQFFGRFPHKILREFCVLQDQKEKKADFSGFLINATKNFLEISKIESKETLIDEGFCILFTQKNSCTVNGIFFEFDGKILSANSENLLRIDVPFLIRSAQNGDFIRMKNGKRKLISKVFSELKIKEKSKIPLVQSLKTQEIVFIMPKKFLENKSPDSL